MIDTGIGIGEGDIDSIFEDLKIMEDDFPSVGPLTDAAIVESVRER